MDLYRLFLHLVRFVVLGFAAYGRLSAGTIDPHTPDSKYIEFGKKFHNVVGISAQVKCLNPECEFKEHKQQGSAVVIRPHWLLTAAHVVRDGTKHTALLADKVEQDLSHVVCHEDFDDSKFGVHDIALCYSPKEIAMEFYPPLYTKSDELGKPITFAGWGFSGTFYTGATKSDGLRRAGQNVVAGTQPSVLLCEPRRVNKFPLEFMIAPGDSGGGMFIGNELAGINSFLLANDGKPDGTYTDESAFTRVSLYTDWVEAQIQAHETALQQK
jgi:hypothetical protein